MFISSSLFDSLTNKSFTIFFAFLKLGLEDFLQWYTDLPLFLCKWIRFALTWVIINTLYLLHQMFIIKILSPSLCQFFLIFWIFTFLLYQLQTVNRLSSRNRTWSHAQETDLIDSLKISMIFCVFLKKFNTFYV